MAGFDLSTITGCYVGSTPATAIYYGSSKIWPATPTPSHDYSQDYLTIVSLEDDNDIIFCTDTNGNTMTISISTDNGSTWTRYTSSTTGTILATLNTDDKLLIKGNNESYYDNGLTSGQYFSSTGSYNVEGNIMSLIYDDNFINQTSFPVNSSHNFQLLFYDGLYHDAKIINACNLILPVTTLADYCYNCMFHSCKSLTTPPELPATTLAEGCYHQLFYGCTCLTTAPELPATILANKCYELMFKECTSLTTAPELPAATLVEKCYKEMFQSCTNLNYIKCLATDISASACTNYMLSNVSPTGTFVKDANATWPTGFQGIPSGWTVIDAA